MSEAYQGDECLRRQVLDHLGAEDAAERAVGQRFQVARASAWSATRPASRQCATIPASRSTPRASRFPPPAQLEELPRPHPTSSTGAVGKEVEVIRWRCRMSSTRPAVPVLEAHVRGRAGARPVPGHGGHRDEPRRWRGSARALDLATQDLDPIRERSEPITRSRWPRCRSPCSAARRSWRLSDWSSSRWLSAPSPPYLVPDWKDEGVQKLEQRPVELDLTGEDQRDVGRVSFGQEPLRCHDDAPDAGAVGRDDRVGRGVPGRRSGARGAARSRPERGARLGELELHLRDPPHLLLGVEAGGPSLADSLLDLLHEPGDVHGPLAGRPRRTLRLRRPRGTAIGARVAPRPCPGRATATSAYRRLW